LPATLIRLLRKLGQSPILFGLFMLAIGTKALLNYFHFKNPSGDLAIFVQMFFNTLQGHFLESSFEGGNHLGVHFSPILILLIPVMAVFQSFPALMICNGLFQASGIWLLHKHLSKTHPNTALIAVIILMSHATLLHDSYKSFHALSMMTLPFFGIFIAYRSHHFRGFVFWCLLLATIRENMFLTLFFWGGVCHFTSRPKKWAVSAIALAMLHFWVANIAAPAWFEGGIRPGILDYFQGYGGNLTEIAANLKRNPILPFTFICDRSKVDYILKILLPFAVILPFFRPQWLIPTAPILAVILFSSNGRLADPKLHFSVEVVLWCALATIHLLQDHESLFKTPKWQNTLAVFGGCYVIFLGFQCGANGIGLVEGRKSERFNAFTEIAKSIEPDATVAAPRYLANHLAWRSEIYFLSEAETLGLWPKVDLLILEDGHPQGFAANWRMTRQVGPFQLFRRPKEAADTGGSAFP